jgi:DNA-binding NtrC family response regulator
MPGKILIADDERHVAEGLQMLLADDGYEVDVAADGQSAWELVKNGTYGVVLADLRMPEIDGLELFARMREGRIASEMIIITGESSVQPAVEAMKQGAYDYLEKPLKVERLKALIPKALQAYEIKRENRELEERLTKLTRFGDLLGQSDEIRRVYAMVEAAAPSTASIFIVGESGTGKELVARAIHDKSNRKKGPFVAINCAAFPREILENELFGHEKGAFTGATNEKPGCFELAHGGTLFLDEVAEMEPDIQVKLLRALEQRSFRRLGGKKEIQVDIRVVAATNKIIAKAIENGELREDLYHRLAVIPMKLPPLRERQGDTKLLAEAFLRRFAEENGKPLNSFSPGGARVHARLPLARQRARAEERHRARRHPGSRRASHARRPARARADRERGPRGALPGRDLAGAGGADAGAQDLLLRRRRPPEGCLAAGQGRGVAAHAALLAVDRDGHGVRRPAQ